MNLVCLGEFGRNGERKLLVFVGSGAGVDLEFGAFCGGSVGDIETFITEDTELSI